MRVDLGGWGLLLIAMAIAYFVCLKASKEGTKLFQYGGYAIGIIILAISLILAISDVGSRIGRQRAMSRRRKTIRPPTMPRMEPPEMPKIPRRTVE